MVKSNTNEIMKLMNKQLKQKKHIVRKKREKSFGKRVQEWKSQKGDVDRMRTDTHWGYSPTSKSTVRPFKPQPKQISERYGYGFPKPLGEIIDEYKEWEELEEIIQELEND